jgi:hypothetical protein
MIELALCIEYRMAVRILIHANDRRCDALQSVGTVHRKGSNRKEKKWPWIAYCAMFNREEDIYYVRVARLADPQ